MTKLLADHLRAPLMASITLTNQQVIDGLDAMRQFSQTVEAPGLVKLKAARIAAALAREVATIQEAAQALTDQHFAKDAAGEKVPAKDPGGVILPGQFVIADPAAYTADRKELLTGVCSVQAPMFTEGELADLKITGSLEPMLPFIMEPELPAPTAPSATNGRLGKLARARKRGAPHAQ